MKRTFIKLCSFLAIVAIGMSSCKKDGITADPTTQENNGETMSLTLNVVQQGIQTRAAGVTATKASFQSAGLMVFASANGTILKKVNISVAPAAGEVSTDNLNRGSVTVNNVPAKAVSVYIIGNTPSAALTNLQAATTLDALMSVPFSISNQSADPAAVTVDGSGAITMSGVGQSAASVTVKPLVARIEIGSIVYASASGQPGEAITDYDLTGIFLSNLQPSMNLNLGGSGTIATGIRGTSATSVGEFTTANYPSSGVIGDLNPPSTKSNGNLTRTPATAGNVWGYNFFPSLSGPVPHIVLQFQNIKGTSGAQHSLFGDQYQWVTVQKFQNGPDRITTFNRNTVYKITAITFSNFNVGDFAEYTYNNATVTVDVLDWNSQTTVPDMTPGA